MAGYPELSALMGSYPEIAIFRRFMTLNMRNVLYLQAELIHLEQELSDICAEDKQSADPVRQSYQRSWSTLEESVRSGGDHLQWTKFLQIRERLEKYSEDSLLTSNTCG
jgi:hypothetical protein